jgi:hypothetical protein
LQSLARLILVCFVLFFLHLLEANEGISVSSHSSKANIIEYAKPFLQPAVVQPLMKKEEERERRRLSGSGLTPSKDFADYKENLETLEKERYFSSKKRSYHTPSRILETTEPIRTFKLPTTAEGDGGLTPSHLHLPRPSSKSTPDTSQWTPELVPGNRFVQGTLQRKTPVITPSIVCYLDHRFFPPIFMCRV